MEYVYYITIAIMVLCSLMLMYLTPKCKHKWKIIQHYTTESQAEHYGQLTGKVKNPDTVHAMDKLCSRQTITILTCEHCGKLDKTIIKH